MQISLGKQQCETENRTKSTNIGPTKALRMIFVSSIVVVGRRVTEINDSHIKV